MSHTTKTHAIDLAAVPVGQHVVQIVTLQPKTLKVKTTYMAPGAFEHCAAIANDCARNKRNATMQQVSDREWFAIDSRGVSTTWKVKRVVRKVAK